MSNYLNEGGFSSYQEVETLELNPLRHLPVAKHLSDKLLSVNSGDEAKRTSVFTKLLTLVLIGAAGYGIWTYVLPFVFTTLGQLIGIASGIAFVAACIALWPAFTKWLQLMNTKLYRAAIESNSIEELWNQLSQMKADKQRFKKSKHQMKGLQTKARNQMNDQKSQAETYQAQVLAYTEKAARIRTKMTELAKQNKQNTDEYHELEVEFNKVVPMGERARLQFQNANEYTRRYGANYQIIKGVNRKIDLAEVRLDNVIADFEVTIKMMQDELNFALDAKNASSVMKSALGFKNKLEINLAMETVAKATSLYIAETADNFKTIDNLTSGDFSLDNDQLFDRLEKLSNKMSAGEVTITETRNYGKPGNRLTEEDRDAAGSFASFFDD